MQSSATSLRLVKIGQEDLESMPRHEPFKLAPIAASCAPFGAVPAFSFLYIKLIIVNFHDFEILQLLSNLKM